MPTPAETLAAAVDSAQGFDPSSLWLGLIGGLIVGILLGWYLHARVRVLDEKEK